MKQSEITAAVLRGECVVAVEFRTREVKPIGRNGNTTNVEVNHVLLGNETVEVQRWPRRGEDAAKWADPGHKKGSQVLLTLNSLERTKWGTRARGTIEPITG